MKRTLSLVLALAMIMSLFTTVSFAGTKTLAGDKVTSITHATHPVEYNDRSSNATVYYMGSAPDLSQGAYGAVLNNGSEVNATYGEDKTLDIDTTSYYVTLAAQEVKVTLATKTYTVEDGKVKYSGASEPSAADLAAGVKTTINGASGLTAEFSIDSDKDILVTLKKGTTPWFTNVDTGYDLVRDVDVAVSITNGNSVTYSGESALKNLIADKLGVSTSNVTALQINVPKSTSVFEFYVGGSSTPTAASQGLTAVTSSSKLVVKAEEGYIGSIDMPYQVTVSGNTYTGKITFSSEYAKAIEATQYASFHNEWFYLNGITGVYALGAENAKTPAGSTSYTSNKIYPNGRTTNWEETYTAYDRDGVARQLTVTFVPMVNDIISYVEDGKAPFDADSFEAFAAAVVSEQIGTVYSGYLYDVRIIDYKVTNGYTLYSGNKALTYSDALTPAKLEAVTMDIAKAGVYYIDFAASYKYYASRNTTTLSTLNDINGRIAVYAGDNGDIVYEVSSGDTVTFDTADFQALYKKLAGSSKVLSTVTVDALPLYGALYSNNRTTNAYKVTVGDMFYVSPKTNQEDLDDLTYWASSAYTTEYSVFVPVTMYGNGGYEEAVVEIVVNGALPFVDVAKNSTFYEYIRYCYNHDIMNGKSATRFDASSSITRAQLVVTLYRMAGSPATHNNKTLPFTDCKSLSNEFSNAVKWAYYNKIVGGTSATTFAPNTAVTRQAMVKILYGYAKAYGMDMAVEYNNHLGYYTDGGNVSASMKDAMNWALDYSLLSGNGNKLNPRGSTSRGAAAKILANFHNNFIG